MIGRDKKRRKKMRKMENSSFQEALKNCLSCLKVEESYQLARRMERFFGRTKNGGYAR